MARTKAVSSGKIRYMGRSATRSAHAAAKKTKGMSSPGSPEAASPTKKSPRKTAPRGKWSEEQLMTSQKSALIDADLVKLLASSAAWHGLDESEKREVLALLPSDVHPCPEPPADDPTAPIPVLPDDFVRYSNNWRDGIRQFQLDLQYGRYDPEWLRKANEAGRERAEGAFDAFKAEEYEQFWGQKQRLDSRVLAGEATKVKLATLIDAGIIRVGDVWKLRHAIGKGAEQVIIEKEARVQEIHGSKLSFVMPGGQGVFLRSNVTDYPKIKSEDQLQDGEKETLKANNESASEAIANSFSPPRDETDSNPNVGLPKCEHPATAGEEFSMKNSGGDETNSAELTDREIHSAITTPLSSARSISPPFSADKRGYGNQETQPQSNIEVVIVSPMKSPCPLPKRSVPGPAEDSEPKRKRGRPRKTPLVSLPDSEPLDSDSKKTPEPEISTVQSPRLQVLLQSYPTLDPPQHSHFNPQSPTKPTNDTTNMSPDESLQPAKPAVSIEEPSPTKMDIVEDLDIIELVPNHKSDEEVEPFSQSSSLSELADTPSPGAAKVAVQAVSSPLPPPANHPNNNEPDEVMVHDISAPRTLAHKIINLDGRKPGSRSSNAWKDIRCYRNNQDMGSLWDVRQSWYLKHNPS